MIKEILEEWKPIPSLDGRYEASNLGNIRNAWTGRVLQGFLTPQGYLTINPPRNHPTKERPTRMVHRLVMEAFHGPSTLTVDHIDGVKTNNRPSNLCYCTMLENVRACQGRRSEKFKPYKQNGKWRARIWLLDTRTTKHLGLFDTPEEARAAYLAAKVKYHGIILPE